MTTRPTGAATPQSRARPVLRPALGAVLLLAVAAVLSCAVVLLTRGPVLLLGRAAAAGRLPALPFGDLLAAVCAGALAGCWLWCLATGAAVAVGALTERRTGPGRLARRGRARALTTLRSAPAPRLVRAVVLAVLGLPLTALAVPAQAAGGDTGRPPGFPAVGAGALTGLPLPDRVAGPRPGKHRPPARQVLVRPGDCLWSIAARHVAGPQAGPDAVAAAVARLRALNARALGPDPDLIFPGTRLVLPAAPPGKEHR